MSDAESSVETNTSEREGLKINSLIKTAVSLTSKPLYSDLTLIWGQCYKTFYVRNLRIFILSYSVCPWQGFPA
jgi:hypothetical protein